MSPLAPVASSCRCAGAKALLICVLLISLAGCGPQPYYGGDSQYTRRPSLAPTSPYRCTDPDESTGAALLSYIKDGYELAKVQEVHYKDDSNPRLPFEVWFLVGRFADGAIAEWLTWGGQSATLYSVNDVAVERTKTKGMDSRFADHPALLAAVACAS
jgi:hypothetical protein